MAVVEVEGVIPTLAMDVEHTVIVLWVEVEVILLLVPAFWSLWRANTVAITNYCKNRCTRGHKAGHKHHTCHEHRTCRH